MKNFKKKVLAFTTAALLSFGSSTLATQGTEKVDLKPAEEITKQTRFTHEVYQTNSGLRQLGYNEEDRKNCKMERVFYGATAKDDLGLGILVYKDANKKLDEKNNHLLIAYFRDANWFMEEEDYTVHYLAYDRPEVQIDYNTFIDKMKSFFDPNRRETLGITWFPLTIGNNAEPSKDGINSMNDAVYVGLKYKDKKTGEMKHLVYTIKINNDKNGYSFKGYGNGNVILQDTDGDILWH